MGLNFIISAGSYSYPKVDNKITNVYLYKLHGSLNWKRHKIYDIEATSEERRSYDSNYVENLLVYPTLSPKDGAEVEPIQNDTGGVQEIYGGRRFMHSNRILL